ncbi:MAG TPA: hypothetical protein VFE72_02800 [Lysobacter sp.]|nr:hypothetical protein [Lysobacter sp.]
MATVRTGSGTGPRIVVRERAPVRVATVRAQAVQIPDADAGTVIGKPTERVVKAVAAGPQGREGPQGVPGPSGLATVERIALATLGGHRVVRSANAAGAVDYADATDEAHGDDTLGVTTGAAEAGAPITVLTAGSIDHAGWAWLPGAPVFLGLNGLLTQAEAPDAAFEQVIGFAETPTRIAIQIQPAVYY